MKDDTLAQLVQAEDTISLLRSHLSELAKDLFQAATLLEGLDPLNVAAEHEKGGIIGHRAANARSVLTEELIARTWAIQERAEKGAKDSPG